ncbi:MAG: phosphatidylglycerol lysyltransferase domain-containing protein [Dysgonomonas sp.]|nr:phosphatidylglycerol lysyltransferase domain-containing protein [Dysgonomonas sp.]
MISFKQIELSDKPKIDACLEGNIFRSCDFSFCNMFAWNVKFKTQFDICNKTLFLRFVESDGYMYYMMPIGPMPLKEAIQLMKEDAKACNIPFRMKGITLRMWDIIQKELPGEFEYIHDRNNDEYIYLSEKLITLSGKKLQSKRNHINRFKTDNPDWEYFPLTSANELDECAYMLDEWENLKDDKEKSLRYDYIATKLMLEHFDYLQLKGGAIRVNGKIVAFTIGEKLTEDSFVVHVEKAFGEVNGAYTIVNQQFIQHEASSFKYINREEDMGLEPLRKAKLSYQPEILLEEAILIPIAK